MEPSRAKPHPAPTADDRGRFVAETRFDGAVVWYAWPREAVEEALPRTLRIASAEGSADGTHPVVFIFGEHYRSRVFFASLTVPTDIRFGELVIAIPFVRPASGTRVGMFLPRVFSAEGVVTWSGNAHYGFAKRMVAIERFGNTLTVSDRDGLLAHFMVEPTRPWRRPLGAADPTHSVLEALSELPVFGRRADGHLVTSAFKWGFEEAWIRAGRATMSIDAPLGPGLSPDVRHGPPAACHEVCGMRWRLSWPRSVVP